MAELLPLFLTLTGRRVLLVGGGPVAASKLESLLATGADVRVVSPAVQPSIERSGVPIERRGFTDSDLDGAWLVVAAAAPEINRQVAVAAETRRIFVNAIDDPANATAFLSGVVRRDGVTLAISTSGHAPGLAGLLREALDAVLPSEIGEWMRVARAARVEWRRDGVPMDTRRPLLLRALNRIYGGRENSEFGIQNSEFEISGQEAATRGLRDEEAESPGVVDRLAGRRDDGAGSMKELAAVGAVDGEPR
jgi:uroporphyrin-III C-methyltransferase/precorrin-2 dehydrogenase/sirohydrochlorin ferrochelatase